MDFLSALRAKPTVTAIPDTEDEEDITVVKVQADTEVAHMQMENTVKAIRARLLARLSLQKQLNNLEKARLPSFELVPAELTAEFPTRVTSKLRGWSVIDWEAYSG